MQQRPLGNSNLQAGVVALGCWVLGGGPLWGKETEDQESIRTIQTALDLGMNLLDTAPAYGWGRSEEVVGKALKGRRDKAILATKCGLWWEDERGSFFAELAGKNLYRCLRPDTLRIEIENSLRRLQTDYIDLYQSHWPAMPPEKTPVADTMAALLKMKDQGKIRQIGVCNVTLDELKDNLACGPVVSDQFRYSILYRDPEKDILPFSANKNIGTLTYMSLEQGLLTGKIGMDRTFDKNEFRSNEYWNPWLIPVNRRRVLDMLAGWQALTRKYNCSLSQLVIAWTARQHGVTHVLCGGRTVEQVKENAKAGELKIEQADLDRMRADAEGLGAPATA